MVFQVFCDSVDYIRSLVSSSVNVRRLDIQFIRNERNVAEEACENPVVVGSVEICFGSISFPHFFLHAGSAVVVVEEIVGLSDTAVCRIPNGVDVGYVRVEISSADVSPCCRYRPWSAVCCDFGLVEPFFSGKTVGKRVGYTAEVLFRLPEVCVRQFVVWHPVKE